MLSTVLLQTNLSYDTYVPNVHHNTARSSVPPFPLEGSLWSMTVRALSACYLLATCSLPACYLDGSLDLRASKVALEGNSTCRALELSSHPAYP